MSAGKKAEVWLRLWPEKFLWGTMKPELEVDERAVWVDLLCLAAMFMGKVDITYTKALAGRLMVPQELLERSLKKLEKTKRIKIKVDKKEEKTYAEILKWKQYQSKHIGGGIEIKGRKKSDTLNGPRATIRKVGLEESRREESRGDGEGKSKTPPKKTKYLSFPMQDKLIETENEIIDCKKKLENPELEDSKKTQLEKRLKSAEEILTHFKEIRKKWDF